VIQGIGASPGRVQARARLVHDPRTAELAGEVLVANRTDPGWVPLFPSAAAIVVERGSMLSHSAIVAREFGIPCVVGARDALRILRDGQRVDVDGTTGRIVALEGQDAGVKHQLRNT
jgi:pyruvate,water dikinase